ncbi:MAG: response regulator [Clostridiales bacterium]|nr:response regulator [Clostridiales bacterium]
MTNMLFAETLRKLRSEKEMSQRELAERMYVTRSAVVRWENGSRMPDAAMITRLSRVLGTDIGTLFSATAQNDDSPIVIMVDDNKAILSDSLPVLEEVMPSAVITGFIWPQEALDYAKTNRIALAILDIELGTASGLDLSRRLLEINPLTNVVFLTAYPDYALDAWATEASGFVVKPLTPERLRDQLKKLRYPFSTGGTDK